MESDPVSDRQQVSDKIRNRGRQYLDSPDSVGIAIAAIQDCSEHVFFGGTKASGGDAPPDDGTLFEIGSITKVFTTTLLAEMHCAGELSLDDPVNRYLPPPGQLSCPGGRDVTLRHLATHTSGLPRLPANLTTEALSADNPYAHYSSADLYRCLARCRLKSRPGSNTRYSNLGSGLLGHVLSLVGGGDYEELMIARILHPLGMLDTTIHLSDEQQQRMAAGHSKGTTVGCWDFQVLAPAGAFRSTIRDMLLFLRANIAPEATPLSKAIQLTHELQTQFKWRWYGDIGCIGPLSLIGLGSLLAWRSFGLPLWLRFVIPVAVPVALLGALHVGLIPTLDDMALGWQVDRPGGDDADPHQRTLWHNGATAGFASYLAFSRLHGTGVVLLTNSDIEPDSVGRELLLDLLSV